MRLRDKKCGETHDYGFSSGDDGSICVGQDGDFETPTRFNSLAELCERFEDAPEDIKPFEEVAKVRSEMIAAPWNQMEYIKVADIDYYEILPDGTKKTKFTWDEAMEIEKKTHGKWRVPTVPEIFAICAAFGRSDDGTDVNPQILKDNLGLAIDEDGVGDYWSAAASTINSSRYLDFYGSCLYPRYGGSKGYGFAVRCVAGEGK